MNIYYVKENEVWVKQVDHPDQLFLTVHRTTATVSPKEQAEIIAKLLNKVDT